MTTTSNFVFSNNTLINNYFAKELLEREREDSFNNWYCEFCHCIDSYALAIDGQLMGKEHVEAIRYETQSFMGKVEVHQELIDTMCNAEIYKLESELSEARKACREATQYSWEMVKNGMLTMDDRATWDDISEKSDVCDSIKAKLIKIFPDWVDSEQMAFDAVDTDSDSEELDSDNESEHPSLDEEESDDELRYNGDDLS